MAGSIQRRCGCRDPETGKQLGKHCPRLKNPRHGSWGFALDAPGADGLRLQIRRGGFATRREAEMERDALAVEVRSGRRAQRGAGKVTVAEYLRQWIVDKERDGLRAKTLESYRFHVERIWVPAVGRPASANYTPGRWRRRCGGCGSGTSSGTGGPSHPPARSGCGPHCGPRCPTRSGRATWR
jgi:hypothetical protein